MIKEEDIIFSEPNDGFIHGSRITTFSNAKYNIRKEIIFRDKVVIERYYIGKLKTFFRSLSDVVAYLNSKRQKPMQ